jgi:uncharacterized protein (DUF58 family)
MSRDLRRGIDYGKLVPLRLRARALADGLFAGPHRSARRGTGVEFGGHRQYVPGDDLRWLDRHALMRHGRLLIREFETETDRTLFLIVDASVSMGFKSASAPCSKLEFSSLIAAGLARVALAGGDAVGLSWVGGKRATFLPPTGGREAFERLVAMLETAEPGGDLLADPKHLEDTFGMIGRDARRGSVIVFLSDLLDLPEIALRNFAPLGSKRRAALAVQVLDPIEARFPLEGPVRLKALEGDTVIETDGPTARAGYLRNLAAVQQRWQEKLLEQRGQLITAATDADPLGILISILDAARGGTA